MANKKQKTPSPAFSNRISPSPAFSKRISPSPVSSPAVTSFKKRIFLVKGKVPRSDDKVQPLKEDLKVS